MHQSKSGRTGRQLSADQFDNLPNEAFIRQSQLINGGIVPFSASTLWRRIRVGRFPRPTKLSDQITAFRVGEIRQWLRCPDNYTANQEEALGLETKNPGRDAT